MRDPVKRYVVAAGYVSYPDGGGLDFYGSADTVDAAKAVGVEALRRNDWAQIVDRDTWEVLFETDHGTRKNPEWTVPK